MQSFVCESKYDITTDLTISDLIEQNNIIQDISFDFRLFLKVPVTRKAIHKKIYKKCTILKNKNDS